MSLNIIGSLLLLMAYLLNINLIKDLYINKYYSSVGLLINCAILKYIFPTKLYTDIIIVTRLIRLYQYIYIYYCIHIYMLASYLSYTANKGCFSSETVIAF